MGRCIVFVLGWIWFGRPCALKMHRMRFIARIRANSKQSIILTPSPSWGSHEIVKNVLLSVLSLVARISAAFNHSYEWLTAFLSFRSPGSVAHHPNRTKSSWRVKCFRDLCLCVPIMAVVLELGAGADVCSERIEFFRHRFSRVLRTILMNENFRLLFLLCCSHRCDSIVFISRFAVRYSRFMGEQRIEPPEPKEYLFLFFAKLLRVGDAFSRTFA